MNASILSGVGAFTRGWHVDLPRIYSPFTPCHGEPTVLGGPTVLRWRGHLSPGRARPLRRCASSQGHARASHSRRPTSCFSQPRIYSPRIHSPLSWRAHRSPGTHRSPVAVAISRLEELRLLRSLRLLAGTRPRLAFAQGGAVGPPPASPSPGKPGVELVHGHGSGAEHPCFLV